jgi:hypothetical protein
LSEKIDDFGIFSAIFGVFGPFFAIFGQFFGVFGQFFAIFGRFGPILGVFGLNLRNIRHQNEIIAVFLNIFLIFCVKNGEEMMIFHIKNIKKSISKVKKPKKITKKQ